MNKIIIVCILVVTGYACTNAKDEYSLANYKIDYDGLLDTILPYFASLHDSIPSSQRFLPKNRGYMDIHKKERQYEWMYYAERGGYSYFMVRRLQPSLKKDKYTAICGRFSRDAGGHFDSSSYEELFWTWKMKQDSLELKSATLFNTAVGQGDLKQYMPESSEGFWIEFPNANVVYDKASKSWKSKSGY